MPIEIRELVIKAAVSNAAAQEGKGGGGVRQDEMEASIQEALEQMNDLKRKEKER